MDRCVGAAARLPGGDRKDLAIQALARSETVSDLAARHGVSRKFVYQQTHKARAALADAFSPAVPDSEVLFELAVTKAWLRQVIVGLTLICRSSYRGVVEFLRDLLGVSISVGCVHDVLQSATRQADLINRQQDLSGIRVGLHDEIFQGATPVLAGVDAASTYCYLLATEQRRDADTWGVHLLDAAKQGLRPDYTIADAGQGLRAGQRAAWGSTPCHGDVFHIQRQCEGLANTLARLAQGTTSRRKTLQAKTNRSGHHGPSDELATQLALARQAETQAHALARDIRTLTQWLGHDVLALAGPALATRQALFDFIVEELVEVDPVPWFFRTLRGGERSSGTDKALVSEVDFGLGWRRVSCPHAARSATAFSTVKSVVYCPNREGELHAKCGRAGPMALPHFAWSQTSGFER